MAALLALPETAFKQPMLADCGNLAAHGLPGTKASSSDTAALLAVLKGLTFGVRLIFRPLLFPHAATLTRPVAAP